MSSWPVLFSGDDRACINWVQRNPNGVFINRYGSRDACLHSVACYQTPRSTYSRRSFWNRSSVEVGSWPWNLLSFDLGKPALVAVDLRCC